MWETSYWIVKGFFTHPVHIYSSTLRLHYSMAVLSLFQASYVNSHNNDRRLAESAWNSCKQAKLLLLPALYYVNTFLLVYQLAFCKVSSYSFLPFSSKNWTNIHPWALSTHKQTDSQECEMRLVSASLAYDTQWHTNISLIHQKLHRQNSKFYLKVE